MNKRVIISSIPLFVIALTSVMIWSYGTHRTNNTNKDVDPQTATNTTRTEVVAVEAEETPQQPVEPRPVTQRVVAAPANNYQFPFGVKTSFDASEDINGGNFVGGANRVSFVGRDLYILQQLNATIGLEVNPNAGTVVFPEALRFPTDHDGVENVTVWRCGGASMSDRDSYLLYALTQIRRGRNATVEPFAFYGTLRASNDNAGTYTAGQCQDVDGVTLEGRDRFLIDMINQLSITDE